MSLRICPPGWCIQVFKNTLHLPNPFSIVWSLHDRDVCCKWTTDRLGSTFECFFLDSSENGYDSNLAISSVFFIIIESGIVIWVGTSHYKHTIHIKYTIRKEISMTEYIN